MNQPSLKLWRAGCRQTQIKTLVSRRAWFVLVFICVNLRPSAVKFFAFYSCAFVSIRGCVCGLW
jgi:hypothetical protein